MTARQGGSLNGNSMRFAPLRSVLPLFALALASLVGTAACGRTDLEEDLVFVDSGVADVTTDSTPPPAEAGQDQAVPDVATDRRVPKDGPVRRDVNPPPFDAPFDVGFDAPFDAPRDAPRDVGHDSSTCGNGLCDHGETCTTCPLDCGFCPKCGDGTCNPGETCSSCPQDCGSCATCPDGFCDNGENCLSCPADCGVCPSCGDGKCNGTENCTNCPQDCGKCQGCGDGECSQNETCVSCPADCGSCAYCGNGKCEASAGETCNSCPQDCGQCPIATTCQQILLCSYGCFQGGLANFQISCIADCDANACTQAVGFANQATDCIIQSFITGKCNSVSLTCFETQCGSQIAACLGAGPCPGSG